MEKQSGHMIKALRSDRGGEFLSNEFGSSGEEQGIKCDLTTPYTPQQNEVLKRKNRIVMEMARSLLKCRGLPNRFWAEVVVMAVYIINISPTKAVIGKTPYQAWFGTKPYMNHLRVFGCLAFSRSRS